MATQSTGGTLQIDRVPQHDGRHHQVEAAGPITLLLEAAVADFTQLVEEHGPCFAYVWIMRDMESSSERFQPFPVKVSHSP